MGGNEDINVDVQVVTATNSPLEERVRNGKFREDLYYRLKVFEIHLPPLRERKGDISLLAEYFLSQLRKKGRTAAKNFTDEAIEIMLHYRWPGNVRELKSVVESAALRSKLEGGEKITKKHLAPLLMIEHSFTLAKGDVFRSLAAAELGMVEDALMRSGGKKTEAWKLLKYPNRFAMLRRVKKILGDYPDLSDKFPELKRTYS
jgi:DNA-binding NtrC family response regulator